MKLAFWKKQAPPPQLETLSWNFMVRATDPDECWDVAQHFRATELPENARTCEVSFLMGSVVRNAIRELVPESKQRACVISAEAAYFKTFDDQSDDPLPPEMVAVYGSMTLGHVARIALAAYGEGDDQLYLSIPVLVRRFKGDPRMAYEIAPFVERRAKTLTSAFSQVIRQCNAT